MNKRIYEFRAWYLPDKDTPDGILKFVQQEQDGELFFVCEQEPEIKYPFYVPFVDPDWVVEQYTGVDDKLGIKIFDGDIAESYTHTEETILVNVFRNKLGNMCFRYIRNNGNVVRQIVDNTTANKHWKIIGNIHQNPELLR